MKDSLFKKLCDINILRRAWHLSRSESRNDFILDSFRYSDFAFNLEENLRSISIALEKDQYQSKPILTIDVPKSTLSVRPGCVTSIEDRIVLFSIIYLIASKLDKKLPENVYSYRLKKKKDSKSLFKDLEILQFPFLKRKTIQKRVSLIEPWYGQWPKFVEKTIYAFEKEGYKFLTISDISAYFENINISILRDNLIDHLKGEQKIINFLYSLLEDWTWPTMRGLKIRRGIPQGSEAISFLGNIYLLPLDEEFKKFTKKRDIKYFRYMDDVKIFSKEEDVAREALFVMNDVLRKIHLNIQGSKTAILKGEEIKEELFDQRMENVNKIIINIQNNLEMTSDKRNEYIRGLQREYNAIRNKNKIIKDKDLRLYRRLITGFTLLKSSHMVNNVLKQLPMNPDERLIRSASRCFKYFPQSNKKISNALMSFLKSPINLFPYQEAYIISIFRDLRTVPNDVIEYSRKCLRLKSKHWYVRVQSALLLANLNLHPNSLESIKRLYEKESNIELKRALIKCLCQLKSNKILDFLQELIFDNHYKISFLGRMLIHLYYNRNNSAQKEIAELFREFDEDRLLEFYYKIDIIKHCRTEDIRKNLLKKIKRIKSMIKKTHLRHRVNKTIELLKESLENP